MANCKDVPTEYVNIGCQTIDDENEHVLSAADHTAVAASAALHHLEEDNFEDAVENLTLNSSVIIENHMGDCNNLATEHKSNTLQPLCSNLQAISDKVSTGTNVRAASKCEDEKVATQKQESADDDAMIIDEEELRQKEACLTYEQKQVIF